LPFIPAINQNIDAFKAKTLSLEACELGNLAEPALKAQTFLEAASNSA